MRARMEEFHLYSSSFPPCWVCRWYLSAAVTCFSADWAITSSVSRDCAGFRTSRVRFPLASWLDNPVSCIGSNFSGTRPIWCSSDRISATWIRLWCRVWSYFIIIISVDDRNNTFIPSLFLSLAFETQEEHSARGRRSDGRCGVRRKARQERENDQQTRGTKREKRRKKCRKNLEIWKTNRRFFFLHFFPPLSRLFLLSTVCPFFLKARVFCCFVHHFARYKNTPTLCCSTNNGRFKSQR